MRVVAWAISAALQQLLLLLLAALAAVAVVATLATVAGSLLARLMQPAVDRHLDREWSQVVEPLTSFAAAVPVTTLNDPARQLEAAAAELGIALAPAALPNRRYPDSIATTEFEEVVEELASVGQPAPDPEITEGGCAAWRDRHRAQIAEAIGVLHSRDAPSWDHDLRRMPNGPATNLVGHVNLHRVLAAEAFYAYASGDPAGATRALEASWRFGQVLVDYPQLEAHEAALTVLELQAAALRRVPIPGHGWQERLRALDPTARARRAYLCRTWQLRRQAETLLAERHPLLAPILQPLVVVLATQHHEATLSAVIALDSGSVGSFDPGLFAAHQVARVPRWNQFARSAMISSWDSWPRSVRAGLLAELTRRVLRIRELYRTGETADLTGLRPLQPSRVTGLDWRYQVTETGVVVTLEPDPFSDRGSPPLRTVVTPLGSASDTEE
jgi:hypothetical protein